MIGFTFKNFVLQVVQGAVVLLMLIYLYFHPLMDFFNCFRDFETILALIFLAASFFTGVIIDFIADNLEALAIRVGIITPPCFFLLTRKSRWGISLAHRTAILNNLCRIAGRFSDSTSSSEYKKRFMKKNLETVNYILQVAKNRAFRKCKEYQREQIESFFVLYIFSRNIALSLAFPLVVFTCKLSWWALIFVMLVLIAKVAAYRYFLYYSRILLGSTFNAKKDKVI